MGKALLHQISLERDELDKTLGGGIPANCLMLIEGNDGAGKSLIAQRLTFGLLQHKSSVTYITTELNLTGFIQQMDSLNYKCTKDILDEKLLIVPMFPKLGNVKLKNTFMKDILTNEKLFENDVIVFDTLSFLLISDETGREGTFDLISFIKKINGMNKTIIFCVDPLQLHEKFLAVLRSVVDVYLKLEAKEVLGQLLRVVSIIRFRKSLAEVTPVFAFKVIPGSGFAQELASLS